MNTHSLPNNCTSSRSVHHKAPEPVRAVAGFFVLGSLVSSLLLGLGLRPSAIAKYFEPSWPAALTRQPLNVSEPIYVEGKLCPSGGLLALYTDASSQGCLVTDRKQPVTIVAEVMAGEQYRVFRVEMATPQGPIDGWVSSNSLRN